MFEIYGGTAELTQWTKNQKLIMNRLPIGAEVLFYNDPNEDNPLITKVYEIGDEEGNKVNVCDIPNIFLTQTNRIKVRIPKRVVGTYGIVHSFVGPRERYFNILAAERPPDYIYEETVVQSNSELDRRVKDLEIRYRVVKSPDEYGNYVKLREIESGTYILDGRFIACHPPDSEPQYVTFPYGLPVVFGHTNAGSYMQCFFPPGNTVQFATITESTFVRNDIHLLYAPELRVKEVTLAASDWVDIGNGTTFKQLVYVPNTNNQSKVDLMPNAEQMESLMQAGITMHVVNAVIGGKSAFYAVGSAPTEDLAMKVVVSKLYYD